MVIDVFRFTTAALAALEAGAAGIYVVKEVEEAIELRAKDPRLLLAGERRALKVPGFDFGNSPLEFTNRVQGRRIVWCTTNGTNAVTMAAAADEVILASLRSAAAAAEYLSAQERLHFGSCRAEGTVFLGGHVVCRIYRQAVGGLRSERQRRLPCVLRSTGPSGICPLLSTAKCCSAWDGRRCGILLSSECQPERDPSGPIIWMVYIGIGWIE